MRTLFPQGAPLDGDAALISATRSGDAEAYAELTARHAPAARRLAALLVPADAVEALVSEAFAKVRLVLQRGDGPELAFRPYLLTAVRRLHVGHRPVLAGADAAAHPTGAGGDAAAARAFTSLAEPWRMVLWHTEVEGQDADEVAVLLGEPATSVPALAARAREGMRIAWLTMHEATTDPACAWTRAHLGAYVRKVSFDRDTARVEAHLGGCAPCTAVCAELTETTADLRAILAPLVLGPAADDYLATARPERPTPRGGRRRRAGAPVLPAAANLGRLAGGVAGAAAATGAAPAAFAGLVRNRLDGSVGRTRQVLTTRTAAAAVTGVAAVTLVGGGVFVVTQTTDGSPRASAEAPVDSGDLEPAPTDGPTDDARRLAGGSLITRITQAATPGPSDDASETPSIAPSESGSTSPSAGPSLLPGDPGPDGGPSQPGEPDEPGEEPTRPPDQQPTRPPTQQPSQQPSQPPSQPPTQLPTQLPTPAPTPPTDLGISSSSRDLAGLLWGMDVRVTGLAPDSTATLLVRSSGGPTGLTMDGSRCSRTSDGGATCRVTSTPTTFHFNANAFASRPNTITFTVVPNEGSDADTSNNSTSVTIRP